jgi:hypothetical protein
MIEGNSIHDSGTGIQRHVLDDLGRRRRRRSRRRRRRSIYHWMYTFAVLISHMYLRSLNIPYVPSQS